MKKVLISMGFAALALGATAQVKIKDGSVTGSSTTPNSNAILELESNNKGLIYPRVGLQATNLAAPLSQHVKGIVVYDTATAGSGSTAVSPGIYYNDGTSWVRVAQGSPNGSNWRVFGSTATPSANGNPASNTDSQYVMGRVAIGLNTMNRLYATTAGSDSAHKFAYLAVNGDASINGITVGKGGSQVLTSTAVGLSALYSNITGNNNTAIGFNALYNNTTGNNNIGVGSYALSSDTSGNHNVAIGYRTLNTNTTGSQNVAIGSYSLYSNTTGSGNTFLGYQVGYPQSSGDRNIAIGYSVNLPSNSGNYQLNIGNAIWGTGVDSSVANAANIGINTSIPTSSFQVNGSQSGTINVQSGSYTLTATDYTVVFTATATATLPAASGIRGRIYRLVNETASATLTTSSIIALNGSTVTSIPAASAMTVQSDGTNWRQVQ